MRGICVGYAMFVLGEYRLVLLFIRGKNLAVLFWCEGNTMLVFGREGFLTLLVMGLDHVKVMVELFILPRNFNLGAELKSKVHSFLRGDI